MFLHLLRNGFKRGKVLSRALVKTIPGDIRHHLQPSDAESRRLLGRIIQKHGVKGAAELLGCSVLSVLDWSTGRSGMSGISRRLIWVHYVILFAPDTVQSLFDLATWGRFRRVETDGQSENKPDELH